MDKKSAGKSAAKSVEVIEEVVQRFKTITLELTGTRPMLQHNGRLSNPLDSHTRAVGAIAKKRKKTDKELADLALLEARGGMYETPDGYIGLPFTNVWKSIYNAATAFKLGEDVKRALVDSLDIAPILIDGQPVLCDEFLSIDQGNRLNYCPVVVNRSRTMRARSKIPTGWTASVSFTLLDDVLDSRQLAPVIARAGRLVGLCDWRPKFGTFDAKVTISDL